MNDKIFFVSKDANWQHYRNEVLTKLANLHGFEIEVLTTGKVKPYLNDNDVLKYRTFTNIFPNAAKPSFFPGAIWYIIKKRPKYVLAMDNASQLTEYLAAFVCKVIQIKFVIWTHGYDHVPINNAIKRSTKALYTFLLFRLAKSVITFSPAGKEYLERKGIKGSKIFVAQNTLDTERLLQVKEKVSMAFNKTAFLNKLSPLINSETKVIIFSGRLKKNKKVANLIIALSKLLESQLNVHLIIIGNGEEKENLLQQVNVLAIGDYVHFIGEVYDDEHVSKYFLCSDVCVIPSYVGLAIVHAFSFGLPFITEKSINHGPEIQFLKDGINGFFVQKDDTCELADVLFKILFNDDLANSLSQNALKTVFKEASIINMVNNMKDALLT